jgi:hypothetical protein
VAMPKESFVSLLLKQQCSWYRTASGSERDKDSSKIGFALDSDLKSMPRIVIRMEWLSRSLPLAVL